MPDFNNHNNEKLSLDEIEELEAQEKKQKKRSAFNIFSKAYEDGKGVDKDEIPICDDPSFVNFFKLIKIIWCTLIYAVVKPV